MGYPKPENAPPILELDGNLLFPFQNWTSESRKKLIRIIGGNKQKVILDWDVQNQNYARLEQLFRYTFRIGI